MIPPYFLRRTKFPIPIIQSKSNHTCPFPFLVPSSHDQPHPLRHISPTLLHNLHIYILPETPTPFSLHLDLDLSSLYYLLLPLDSHYNFKIATYHVHISRYIIILYRLRLARVDHMYQYCDIIRTSQHTTINNILFHHLTKSLIYLVRILYTMYSSIQLDTQPQAYLAQASLPTITTFRLLVRTIHIPTSHDT